MIFEKTILKLYRAALARRYDDTGMAHYFSSTDFPGLEAEDFSFLSSRKDRLSGAFYRYGEQALALRGISARKGLVVFEHGFGGGHRSYMKEVELLASRGYTVFAYDHTGCMRSEGVGTHGLSQSLRDLDDCLIALMEKQGEAPFCVIGHSWGGFSAMNIGALHPELKKLVVISGYRSVKAMVEQRFSGLLLRLYRRAILAYERGENGQYADFDGLSSLRAFPGRALLLYSDNDPIIGKEFHFDPLVSELGNTEAVSFLLAEGKGHNPNYTHEAVSLLAAYSHEVRRADLAMNEAEKAAFRARFDFDRMSAQDPMVWERIFSFLEE